MKILKTDKIREADEYTIKNEPIHSINLMERAASLCAGWIMKNFSSERRIKIFAGPGNNGGDALVIARLLADRHFFVEVYILKFTDKFSKDFSINFDRLKRQNIAKISFLEENNEFPVIKKGDIVVDGIFGSGLSRPAKGFPAEVINYLNDNEALIISVDIPSGLFGEDNSQNQRENIVRADYTLTFQFPNLAFFYPENAEFTGRWYVFDIGLHAGYIENAETDFFLLTAQMIREKLMRRNKFSHKGTYGHGLLISGSYGKMGAEILGARACLRTGIGLLTCHLPKKGYNILQTAVPEAMTSIDESDELFTHITDIENYDAIAVGPGIGKDGKTAKALKKLIETYQKPVVFDADAINIISENKEWLEKIPKNCIFTPHPKEFERLVGPSEDDYHRNLMQMEFAEKHHCVLVLKGAHTSVATPEGKCFFNSTGNSGMATAGSGDVLTGMILSLLAQGYTAENAALLAVYIHGMAGDLACKEKGMEAMIAGDIIENIGNAFKKIHDFDENEEI